MSDKVSYMKRGITGKKYDYFSKDVVRILNIRQSIWYFENGVELLDIYLSQREDGEKVLVFVFDKESSKPYFDLWCKRKTNLDNQNL